MKTWQKVLGVAGAGAGMFLLGAESIRHRMTRKEPIDLGLGDARISIHLPTLNEEAWIRECLESLTSQPLYRRSNRVKIVVLDSESTDDTVEIAEKYADHVLTVSRGKLNARHEGIVWDEEADIIVSTDADCRFPRYWLDHLLEPYRDINVVATHGPVLSGGSAWSPLRAWASGLEFYRTIITARNSSFRRNAYFECGGFDLSVDQLDRGGELNEEEENRFLEKLKSVGEVAYVPVAIETSERGMPLSEVADGEAVERYKGEIARGVRF